MKDNKDAKILICGYKGMVGSAIYANLKAKGYTNFILKDYEDIDLRRQADTEAMFEEIKPDYVFLAAAKVGGIVANNTYKAEFIYDNMAIAMNVINSAYKTGVKKLLNLGSSCIYPKFAPQPMKEEHLLTGELEPTNEPYAIAKISAIKLCRYFNEQYSTNYMSVMPTNLYGLNDNYNLEKSHVLPALIRKMILAKNLEEGNWEFLKMDLSRRAIGYGYDEKINLDDKEAVTDMLAKIGIRKEGVDIWGTGNVLREFLHATDMAAACVYFMENCEAKDMGEFVNIGTGTDLSIRELAELVKDIVGFGGNLDFDPSKPEGTPRKLMDVSRAFDLGWKPKITMREGITAVIDNYMSLYK